MLINVNTQSSIKIIDDKIIYFDPYKISDEINDADLIFITHSHYDHFSKDDIKKVMKKDTIFICPLSIKNDITSFINEERIIFVKPNNSYEVNGYTFDTIPAYNINKDYHKKEYEWCGYLIKVSDKVLYIAGDTDYIPEIKCIKCNIAFVPIGGTFTMNAKEASNFINDIKPDEAIPIHYGSIVGSKKDEKVFTENVLKNIKIIIKL